MSCRRSSAAHELDMPYLLGEKSFRFSGVLGVIAKLAEKLTTSSGGAEGLSYRSFCSDYKAYLRSVAKLSEIEFSTLHSGHGRGVGRGEFEELVARLRFS